MNPLEKAREGAGRAWSKSKQGTTRTAGWVKDGVTGALGKAQSSVSGLRGSTEEPTAEQAGGAGDGAPGVWERIKGATLFERARTGRRVAIAWAVAGILLLAWIGWTIYIWTENGSTAGLGVLISWPTVFVAAAIVAAPFVGAGILVRRHRLAADGAPPIAGGGDAATETKAENATDANSDSSDNDEKEDEDEDDSGEPEDSAEDDPEDDDSGDDPEDGDDSEDND